MGLTVTSWFTPSEESEQKGEWSLSGEDVTGGGVLPVLYGTTKIKLTDSHVIGMYLESSEVSQVLNILYAICKWQIDSMTSITLNGTAIEDFTDIFPVTLRYGENNQEIIQAFGDTKTDTSVGTALTTSFTTNYLGAGKTGFGVGLYFPEGLYWSDPKQEAFGEAEVKIQIQYKLHSSGTWISMLTSDAAPAVASVAHWSGGAWIKSTLDKNAVWFEIEEGSTTPGDHAENDYYTQAADKWYTSIYCDDYERLVYSWHWVAIGDTYIAGESASTQYVTIKSAFSSAFRMAYYRTGLTPGAYDVQVKFYEAPLASSGDVTYVTTCNWDYYREIVEDDLIYPNVALLGFSSVPTDKLNGGMPEIEFIGARQYVYVYDTDPGVAAYVTKSASNPAWACYDMIHQARYLQEAGGSSYSITVFGEPHTRLDDYYSEWEAWAAWCDWDGTSPYTDKKPYTFNHYFDSPISLEEALKIAGECGRGKVLQVGLCFKPVYEHPEPTVVQRFLFSQGNTTIDSFSETFSFSSDAPNIYEVTYLDPSNDYEAETLRIAADGFDSYTGEIKTQSVNLTGCTNRNMALAYGKYQLNRARYLTAVTSWSADVDSIHCEPGDMVEAPADYGGRLLASCTTTTLYLDQSVVLVAGKTYHVIINHQADDVREEVAVTSAAGTRSTITVDALSTAPAEYTRYVLGEYAPTPQVSRLRRIISITRDGDLSRRITAEEFNSSVFEDDVTVTVFPFNPMRKKLYPPAPASVSVALTWILNEPLRKWEPFARVTFVPDMTFNYSELTIPLAGIRIYMHLNTDDTHSNPMRARHYDVIFDWHEMTIDVPAEPIVNKTLYVTGAFRNTQGFESPKCAPAALYIDYTSRPTVSSQVEIDATKGLNGYEYFLAKYGVWIYWLPAGWELVTGKYAPILEWNAGNNYHRFKNYVIAAGVVAAEGVVPDYDTLKFFETPNIGDIYDATGARITDVDDLHNICLTAAAQKLEFDYTDSWVALTVMPVTKTGETCQLDLTQADLGLDWEYLHVPYSTMAGYGTVETEVITNAELIVTQQPGTVYLNEIKWDYNLTAPHIDGFVILYRIQAYWWAWPTDATIAIDDDLTEIIAATDFTLGGGSAAATDFTAAYTDWYARGIPYFYFMLVNATYYELIKVDTNTLAIERGADGTTARSWSAGAYFSYACSEHIDAYMNISDTTQRNILVNPPVAIDQALHCTIFAIKAVDNGYVRSKFAYWDLVTVN